MASETRAATDLRNHCLRTRTEVAERMALVPLAELEAKIDPDLRRRPFGSALSCPGLAVIAEFKRLSPASGFSADGVDLSRQIRAYERGGACAVSIATDAARYGGSIDDIQVARATCGLPILRRDCIVDPYQLYEGAVRGADAVILMVGALETTELEVLLREAEGLSMDTLLEVHSVRDLDTALAHDACALVVSGHDHAGGKIDRELVHRLMPSVPTGVTVVAEGGLFTAEELLEYERIGVDAVLVGEALMRHPDPEAAVRDLSLI